MLEAIKDVGVIVRRDWRFLVGAVVVLWFSLYLNIFGVMSTEAFGSSFKDSESLSVSTVICEGKYLGGQLTIDTRTTGSKDYTCDSNHLIAYSSQFGLQGRLYTAGYVALHTLTHMPPSWYIVLAHAVTALVSAACFALFALWVKRRLGIVAAVTVVIGVTLSPMIVGFGRNLYWALPLMVAPLLYVLAFYRYVLRKKLKPWVFWIGLLLVLVLRFLCGYEYITTIAVAVFAGMSVYLYDARSTLSAYIKQGLLAAGAALLAFGLALGIHVVTLSFSTGSIQSAVATVRQTATERTVEIRKYAKYTIPNFERNLPAVYTVVNSYLHLDGKSESLAWALVAVALNYALMPIVVLPFQLSGFFGVILQSFAGLLLIVIALFYWRQKVFHAKAQRSLQALFLGAALGVLAYLSWLILASSHSLMHAHVNGILMYIPFGLFAFAIVGASLTIPVKKMKNMYDKARTK